MTRSINRHKHSGPSNGGPKRAGIIVRVSSAEQAVRKNKETGETESKFSPALQEKDCREHCRERGYAVANVYYDIQKYRDERGRLVEPSGTRSDRPGLRQALADIDAGKIDVLVGWRQDRLFRGITRALIELKERIADRKVEIELAKEPFNPSTFEILAWAAGVELQAKHDRLMMGVAGRLAKGKVWNHPPLYGLTKVDGDYEVNPEEAKWVSRIWAWYAEGLGAREIRRRLVAAGAPQREENKSGYRRLKHPWSVGIIYRILRYEAYYTGKLTMDWDGEVYVLDAPVLVDAKTAQRVKVRREKIIANPVRHVRPEFLAAGLVYCDVCDVRMSLSSQRKQRRNCATSRYRCNTALQAAQRPECPRQMGAKKLDAEVWVRVWGFMTKKQGFTEAVEQRIKELQAQEMAAAAECGELESRLQGLEEERQRVITAHRKAIISDNDLEKQLAMTGVEQQELERELDAARPLIGDQSKRLMEVARVYRENVQAGFEALNATPATPEQAKLQFTARRQLVQGLVQKVRVGKDQKVSIDLVLGLTVEPPLDPPARRNSLQSARFLLRPPSDSQPRLSPVSASRTFLRRNVAALLSQCRRHTQA